MKPTAWFAVYSAENGQKTSCLSTAPRKCANAGAWSFCASFPVAPQGRGNGTFLIFAMQKHGKNNGHTIQRDCVTVIYISCFTYAAASTFYWRCLRMAACVVATKSRNKQASSIAILRLQSKLFNGRSVNKTGGDDLFIPLVSRIIFMNCGLFSADVPVMPSSIYCFTRVQSGCVPCGAHSRYDA